MFFCRGDHASQMTRLFESLALEDWKQNLYGEKAELGRDNPVFQSEPGQEGLELQVLHCLHCCVVRLGSRSSTRPPGSMRGWRGWRGCCPYRSCGAGGACRSVPTVTNCLQGGPALPRYDLLRPAAAPTAGKWTALHCTVLYSACREDDLKALKAARLHQPGANLAVAGEAVTINISYTLTDVNPSGSVPMNALSLM